VTHLGDLVCALTDGGLGDDAREQALAHVAVCGPCNRQAADQRRVKTLLATTNSAPMPTPDLLGRLLLIPEVAQVEHDLRRSRSRRLLGRTAPSRAPVRLVGARRPASRATGAPRSSGRVRVRSVAAAGFAASVVVGLGGAVSGSSAVSAGAQTGPTLSVSSGTSVGIPIDAAVHRPGSRVAVAVVYRRP
jgi:hypothetical protein